MAPNTPSCKPDGPLVRILLNPSDKTCNSNTGHSLVPQVQLIIDKKYQYLWY
jgi:hypothetical protein